MAPAGYQSLPRSAHPRSPTQNPGFPPHQRGDMVDGMPYSDQRSPDGFNHPMSATMPRQGMNGGNALPPQPQQFDKVGFLGSPLLGIQCDGGGASRVMYA